MLNYMMLFTSIMPMFTRLCSKVGQVTIMIIMQKLFWENNYAFEAREVKGSYKKEFEGIYDTSFDMDISVTQPLKTYMRCTICMGCEIC